MEVVMIPPKIKKETPAQIVLGVLQVEKAKTPNPTTVPQLVKRVELLEAVIEKLVKEG